MSSHRFWKFVGWIELYPAYDRATALPFYDGGGGGVEGGGGKGCWGIGGFLLRRAIVAATMTIMRAMPAMM